MSNEENANEIIDLDFNMEEVAFEYPMVKECVTTVTCVKTYVTGEKGHQTLNIELKTNEPLEDARDATKQVPPGLVMTERCIMYDSGKMQSGDWKKRPAKIHFAFTGEKAGSPNTGAWQGKTAKVKIVVDPERKDKNDETKVYPPRNSISTWYPAGV